MPEFLLARPLVHAADPDELARKIQKQIRHQVLERFKVFEGHTEQPLFVDCEFVDADEIEIIAYFNSRGVAMLWKLAHGGAA